MSAEAFEIDNRRNGPSDPPLRRRRVRDEDPPDPPRSRLLIWLALFAVLVALVGVDWYGLSRLVSQNERLDAVDRWMEQLASVPDRISEFEKRVSALSGSVASLDDRTADMDHELASNLEKEKKATRELGASLRAQIQNATDAQARVIGARLDALEAARDLDSTRTARLERELTQLNHQVAAVSDNVGSVQNAAAQESVALRRDIHATNARVEHVASFNNRPRERFEIGLGTTQEIAPDILLHITRVQPSHRRFHGWLQLVKEGKILWLRDESVLQAVTFHMGRNALRHDLVVTDLSKGGLVGYVILPSVGESADAAPPSEQLARR